MCGRFGLFTLYPELASVFDLVIGASYDARYNIAPIQFAPVFHEVRGQRALGSMRWGLVPAWARDSKGGGKTFNARSETAPDKPSFREAFQKRRCLVPADGFYEWSGPRNCRRPHWFSLVSGRPFAMAGLWERWVGSEGEVLETFALLTTSANELVGPVHDRMPVIIDAEDFSVWLGVGAPTEKLVALLRPFSAGLMSSRRVTTRVNDVGVDDAECLARNRFLETQRELF